MTAVASTLAAPDADTARVRTSSDCLTAGAGQSRRAATGVARWSRRSGPLAAGRQCPSVRSLTMSLPLRQSLPRRGHRLLLWTVAVVIGALICGGIPVWYLELTDRDEQRKEDEEISRYLSLVRGNYHSSADAMLCGGDDTRTATLRETDEPDWGLRRIAAVAIVGSEEWSSWWMAAGGTIASG
jgi:hypothetical protein